jgi:hypothetical protein
LPFSLPTNREILAGTTPASSWHDSRFGGPETDSADLLMGRVSTMPFSGDKYNNPNCVYTDNIDEHCHEQPPTSMPAPYPAIGDCDHLANSSYVALRVCRTYLLFI